MGKNSNSNRDLAIPQDSSKGKPTQNARTGVIRQAALVEQYSGPIPSASELKKYEEVLPGAADRIISMAEQQATHRQKLESSVVKSNIENSRRGQYFAVMISMIALMAGFVLILLNKDATGIAMIVFDLASLVGVFIWNRISESKELSRKRNDDSDDN